MITLKDPRSTAPHPQLTHHQHSIRVNHAPTGDRVADQEISLKTRPIQLLPRSWLVAVRSLATMEAPDQQEKVRGTKRQGCRPRGSLGRRRQSSCLKMVSLETPRLESQKSEHDSRSGMSRAPIVSLTTTRQTQRRDREVFYRNPYHSNRVGPLLRSRL